MTGDPGPYMNDDGDVWVPRTVPYLEARHIARTGFYEEGRDRLVYGNGSSVAKEYEHSNHAARADWPALMGMPWAEWFEVRQAIPPAYSEWLGARLLRVVTESAA